MAEWSKATDCKFVSLTSRWFEPNPFQLIFLQKALVWEITTFFYLLTRKRSIFKWKIFFLNKKLLLTRKIKRFIFLHPFIRKKSFYFRVYNKIDLGVWLSFHYFFYQNSRLFEKKSFLPVKYLRLVKKLRKKNYFLRNYFPNFHRCYASQRLNFLANFIAVYSSFHLASSADIFYFTKSVKKFSASFFLMFSSNKNKLFINLQGKKRKDYLSVSSGFFINFFSKKKSLKKTKTVKLLMAKYLRKFCLILQIKSLILLIKKTPALLLEILRVLNQPIIHKFLNPLNKVSFEENAKTFNAIKFRFFIFLESKNFVINKQRRPGRIKRKVLRKIIIHNQIAD